MGGLGGQGPPGLGNAGLLPTPGLGSSAPAQPAAALALPEKWQVPGPESSPTGVARGAAAGAGRPPVPRPPSPPQKAEECYSPSSSGQPPAPKPCTWELLTLLKLCPLWGWAQPKP